MDIELNCLYNLNDLGIEPSVIKPDIKNITQAISDFKNKVDKGLAFGEDKL